MKETIEFYYGIRVENIYLDNDAYHFEYDGGEYYFVYCARNEKELVDLIECSKELKTKSIDCHDIILNNSGKVITLIDEVSYVLLRVRNKDEEYQITDIIQMNKKTRLNDNQKKNYRNNWEELWSKKIDYIENQLQELHPDSLITNSIDYYIGLCENAISYLNNTTIKYAISNLDNVTLAHRRLYYPNYKLNYLNPLSFIFDLEVRDIAEYIKNTFFKGENAFLELQTYLKSTRLTVYSYNMLFARLLYPSYYFDQYELIINKHVKQDGMLKIIEQVDEYEQFLKKAYQEISLYAPLENVTWLIK